MGSLRFPAFLLVLLYTTVVQISEEVINMNMFPEATDYSFSKCRKEMLQMVTKPGGLLQKELKSNKDFESSWNSSAGCKKEIPGATQKHMTALQIYVNDEIFHKTFEKNHSKSRGNSTYQDEFPFKSIFFLVSDTMELLRKNCTTVYSGVDKEYSAKIGEKVRFKSFFPAKQKYTDVTEEAEAGTIFNINSCSAISLEDTGCESEAIDLLISPTEVFTVKAIRIVKNSNNNYKEITLEHSGFQSSSNCSSLNSVSKPEGSKESSSSLLSCSLLNLMASLLLVYFYMLTM